MNAEPQPYTIESSAPSKIQAVVGGGALLLLAGVNLAQWAADGGALSLFSGVVVGVSALVLGVTLWTLAGRTLPPPLAADAGSLRLAVPGSDPLALPWESLREVRVERLRFGHRVVAVPVDIDTSLAPLPDRARRGVGRGWQRAGRISVGVGQRKTDTDAIVAVLAGLADGRCLVVRG